MSKKIDFNFLHNFLQFIQAKNKWKISEILDNLDISFKELIYILDIVSQIYVDFDDIFIDYEINEDTEEINFLFNDSVYELLSINDSELFNLYYLLTIEANFLILKDSNKEVMEFYNILSKYFNIDGLFASDDNSETFSFEEIKELFLAKDGNTLEHDNLLPFEEINEKIWELDAEIFAPCAASRLITQQQIDSLINRKLEVISCGANVPFADKEIFFGTIMESTDEKVSLIPDFISNCGMARVFAYFMERRVSMTDEAIFNDTSITIKNAIQRTFDNNSSKTNISKSAFEVALKQLL